MRVLFGAGEPSGDAYAAQLASRLRRLDPSVTLEGIGGPQLRALGVPLVADSSQWGAMGVVESVKVGPRILRSIGPVLRALRTGTPGVFVPIDFGFLNVRLCRRARAAGWKVLYFIPPGSWRRDRQGRDLPRLTDAIVTPFQWSADMLNAIGAHAHWFGHPMKQIAKEAITLPAQERRGVAVLPGSRGHEIENNLPAIAGALVQGSPLEPVEFAVAPNVGSAHLRHRWTALAPNRQNDTFTEGDVFGVLGRARAAVVCSGTATLQAAIAGCPQVVVYRLSKATEREARLLRIKVEHIALPNIFLGRRAFPELVQHEATPERIRAELDPLLAETPERTAQLQAIEELSRVLGGDDCLDRTAELILSLGA